MRNTYLDYFRFIAFILMFIYHIVISDFIFFGQGTYNQFKDIYELIGTFARNLFILTSGFSLFYLSSNYSFNKFRVRFLNLLFCSFLITLFSYLLFPEYFIFNGIIHFFMLASVVNFFFLRLSNLFKIFLFLLNLSFCFFILPSLKSTNWFLQVLGFSGLNISTLDFFPFLPWYNLILLGYFTAPVIDFIYKRFPLMQNSITKIGSQSLKAYMIHPLFILVIFYFTRF